MCICFEIRINLLNSFVLIVILKSQDVRLMQENY